MNEEPFRSFQTSQSKKSNSFNDDRKNNYEPDFRPREQKYDIIYHRNLSNELEMEHSVQPIRPRDVVRTNRICMRKIGGITQEAVRLDRKLDGTCARYIPATNKIIEGDPQKKFGKKAQADIAGSRFKRKTRDGDRKAPGKAVTAFGTTFYKPDPDPPKKRPSSTVEHRVKKTRTPDGEPCDDPSRPSTRSSATRMTESRSNISEEKSQMQKKSRSPYREGKAKPKLDIDAKRGDEDCGEASKDLSFFEKIQQNVRAYFRVRELPKFEKEPEQKKVSEGEHPPNEIWADERIKEDYMKGDQNFFEPVLDRCESDPEEPHGFGSVSRRFRGNIGHVPAGINLSRTEKQRKGSFHRSKTIQTNPLAEDILSSSSIGPVLEPYEQVEDIPSSDGMAAAPSQIEKLHKAVDNSWIRPKTQWMVYTLTEVKKEERSLKDIIDLSWKILRKRESELKTTEEPHTTGMHADNLLQQKKNYLNMKSIKNLDKSDLKDSFNYFNLLNSKFLSVRSSNPRVEELRTAIVEDRVPNIEEYLNLYKKVIKTVLTEPEQNLMDRAKVELEQYADTYYDLMKHICEKDKKSSSENPLLSISVGDEGVVIKKVPETTKKNIDVKVFQDKLVEKYKTTRRAGDNNLDNDALECKAFKRFSNGLSTLTPVKTVEDKMTKLKKRATKPPESHEDKMKNLTRTTLKTKKDETSRAAKTCSLLRTDNSEGKKQKKPVKKTEVMIQTDKEEEEEDGDDDDKNFATPPGSYFEWRFGMKNLKDILCETPQKMLNPGGLSEGELLQKSISSEIIEEDENPETIIREVSAMATESVQEHANSDVEYQKVTKILDQFVGSMSEACKAAACLKDFIRLKTADKFIEELPETPSPAEEIEERPKMAVIESFRNFLRSLTAIFEEDPQEESVRQKIQLLKTELLWRAEETTLKSDPRKEIADMPPELIRMISEELSSQPGVCKAGEFIAAVKNVGEKLKKEYFPEEKPKKIYYRPKKLCQSQNETKIRSNLEALSNKIKEAYEKDTKTIALTPQTSVYYDAEDGEAASESFFSSKSSSFWKYKDVIYDKIIGFLKSDSQTSINYGMTLLGRVMDKDIVPLRIPDKKKSKATDATESWNLVLDKLLEICKAIESEMEDKKYDYLRGYVARMKILISELKRGDELSGGSLERLAALENSRETNMQRQLLVKANEKNFIENVIIPGWETPTVLETNKVIVGILRKKIEKRQKKIKELIEQTTRDGIKRLAEEKVMRKVRDLRKCYILLEKMICDPTFEPPKWLKLEEVKTSNSPVLMLQDVMDGVRRPVANSRSSENSLQSLTFLNVNYTKLNFGENAFERPRSA